MIGLKIDEIDRYNHLKIEIQLGSNCFKQKQKQKSWPLTVVVLRATYDARMAQNGIQRCFSAPPVLLESRKAQLILFTALFPNRTASIRIENLKQKNVPKCRCVNAVKLNKQWLTARGGPAPTRNALRPRYLDEYFNL